MTQVELAGGALAITTPAAWKRVKPRNRIIEAEFAVLGKQVSGGGSKAKAGSAAKEGSAAKGGENTARLTIMSAGGTVNQNLDRWAGQFQHAASDNKGHKPERKTREVAGMTLHTIDLAGTYLDSMRGPFGPKTPKPNHRMLAGILETKNHGNYFFKLVGPAGVVSPNAEAFAKALDSVEVKE